MTNQERYFRTKKGLTAKIYNNQKINSKRRGRTAPSYSLLELREFIFNDDLFEPLYKDWVESGYKKDLSPSVDRIEPSKSYSLDNIQLMSWFDNNKKGNKERASGASGKGNGVSAYDSDGNFMFSFNTIINASSILSIDQSTIVKVCKGKLKTAGGYFWKYTK